jgi:hypothetical protein
MEAISYVNCWNYTIGNAVSDKEGVITITVHPYKTIPLFATELNEGFQGCAEIIRHPTGRWKIRKRKVIGIRYCAGSVRTQDI